LLYRRSKQIKSKYVPITTLLKRLVDTFTAKTETDYMVPLTNIFAQKDAYRFPAHAVGEGYQRDREGAFLSLAICRK